MKIIGSRGLNCRGEKTRTKPGEGREKKKPKEAGDVKVYDCPLFTYFMRGWYIAGGGGVSFLSGGRWVWGNPPGEVGGGTLGGGYQCRDRNKAYSEGGKKRHGEE